MSETVRRVLLVCVVLGSLSVLAVAQTPRQLPPSWPYGLPTVPDGEYPAQAPPYAPPAKPVPPPQPPSDVNPLRQIPGSDRQFVQQQIDYGYDPPDWFPQEHPQMPDVVAHGKNPAVRACALCHLPTGTGRAENAPIRGLPYDYFVQQLLDFRNGLRASADPRKPNTSEMVSIGKALTDDEIREAARYYGAMPWTSNIRVVEAETIPKMQLGNYMFLRVGDGSTEPLGYRIVESPEDTDQMRLRNPRSGYVAYVPPGSVERGKALATTGGGRTTACSVCHGADLAGLGPIPGIAGRSPSYLARQMYDIKLGTRRGAMAALMVPVVVNLTEEDIVDLMAYVASLNP